MSFVDKTEVWMEPFLACRFNDTIYNPEWRLGDPSIKKMKEAMEESRSTPEFHEIMQEEMENLKKHPNISAQEKFR